MSKCVSTYKEEENEHLYARNIPSSTLQPYVSVRPVMTKYSYLPIVDPRRQINAKLNEQPTYNINSTFNPGTDIAPWSGFASNVNTESVLRNQIYALQKSSQAVYVPSSTSDLYSDFYKPKNTGSPHVHQLLFKENQFNTFNPNPDDTIVGSNMFMNATRSQVKDMTPQDC
jgi:hypothetical protein